MKITQLDMSIVEIMQLEDLSNIYIAKFTAPIQHNVRTHDKDYHFTTTTLEPRLRARNLGFSLIGNMKLDEFRKMNSDEYAFIKVEMWYNQVEGSEIWLVKHK